MSNDNSSYTRFLDDARQAAAQCWCTETTSHIEMDPALAEVFAHQLAAWIDSASHFANGMEYYRGLLERCGRAIGEAARTCDDGTVVPDVLCSKVPELVEALCNQ